MRFLISKNGGGVYIGLLSYLPTNHVTRILDKTHALNQAGQDKSFRRIKLKATGEQILIRKMI